MFYSNANDVAQGVEFRLEPGLIPLRLDIRTRPLMSLPSQPFTETKYQITYNFVHRVKKEFDYPLRPFT